MMYKISKVGFASCIQAGYTKQIAASFAPILFPKTNKKTDEQICEYIDRLAADFDRYTPFLDTLPARHVVSVNDSRIIFSDGSALRFDGFGKHRFFRVDKELLISRESYITCAESDAIRDIKYNLKALEATLSDIIIM